MKPVVLSFVVVAMLVYGHQASATPGTLTMDGDFSFPPGATLDWDVDDLSGSPGTNWDLIIIENGSLTFEGTWTINVASLIPGTETPGVPGGYIPGDAYSCVIIETDEPIIGFDPLAVNFTQDVNLFTGFSIGAADEGTDLALAFQAVPEPSTLFLLATGALGLLVYARRKRG